MLVLYIGLISFSEAKGARGVFPPTLYNLRAAVGYFSGLQRVVVVIGIEPQGTKASFIHLCIILVGLIAVLFRMLLSAPKTEAGDDF